MLQPGVQQIDVAAALGVSQSVVSQLHTRFRQHGNVADRPWNGRQTITNMMQDRYLTLNAQRRPSITSSLLWESLRVAAGVIICTQIIQNCLHDTGLRAKRPPRYIALTEAQRHQK